MKLFYLIFHVFIFLFGLILVISPPSLLNYFTKRDMENTNNPYKETLLKNKKICMIGGFYCIGISLLSFLLSNIIMIIISYIVIPIVGLYILENKLK